MDMFLIFRGFFFSLLILYKNDIKEKVDSKT
jgi:hypothetical protein